ncbi:lipoprotein insertase outer membrane protein LolB [Vibrio hippocampi]|uniref:Outer-membrane lipoprotein LolB n=1 Tax=Vibrio hippocampi TaxID=654686 RepID=A0ABN8DJ54_9VIBR|nr:lipoprotein insertase outer membrane protein LolB [Vibrio hippocampi]CAH0526618.1 Outer-membrane lipoprotein LolB [Vibrio hippocampi]
MKIKLPVNMFNRLKPYRLCALICATLYLIGCSTMPEQATSVEWQSHQARLQALSQYTVTGKLAYISPQERQSLNFFWSHKPQQTQIRLTTFLGKTVLSLNSDKNGSVIETYDGQTLKGKDVNQLITQLTGLNIPIAELQQWLIGLPGASEQYQLNELNTLESLMQPINGQPWQLNYGRYGNFSRMNDVDPIAMPTQIKMQQRDTKINLVVSKWTLEPQ